MSNVVSLAAVRSEKLKQALSMHGSKGEAVVIETGSGAISVERMICRERFAEILSSAGEYLVLDYTDILSIRAVAVAQTSIVNANGRFQFLEHSPPEARTVPILPFEPRRRRRL